MEKYSKLILAFATMAVFISTSLFLPRLINAGNLEPEGPPGPTMKTLDDVYNKLLDIENKMVPRFSDQEDGTVIDMTTGLIWLKDANCFGGMNWDDAMGAAAALSDGQCGLTDGSQPGDWRLPTLEELEFLNDTRYNDPALCNAMCTSQWEEGDAFNNVQSSDYWSSTVNVEDPSYAWGVDFNNGVGGPFDKSNYTYVWCVRGGL